MRTTLLLCIASLLTLVSVAQSTMPITTESDGARQSFLSAREKLSSVWITGGIEELELALKQDSTLAIAHVYQGVSNFFLGKNSANSLAKAHKYTQNASEGEQWMIEGWIQFFSGNRDSAAYAFEQVIRLHPDEDYASHILGDVYRMQHRYKDAFAIMKPLAIKAKPYTYALNHIAYTYKDMGQMDSAFVYMQRFIDANPGNANAYHSMAEMHVAAGNVPLAMLNFQKAFLADPNFAAALLDLGNLLAQNGETVLAQKAYDKAKEKGLPLYGDGFFEDVEKSITKLKASK